VTEFTEIPGRGHALVIDSGWRDVPDTVGIIAIGWTLQGG